MAKFVYTDLQFNDAGRVRGILDPALSQDAATKRYVDAAIEGIKDKGSARVATVSNINLSSPGSTIDGVAVSAGDYILVKDQTDATENGLYVFNGASTPMTRAPNADTSTELTNAIVIVAEGSSTGSTFRQTAVEPVLGTDDISFAPFGTNVPLASETTAGRIEIATQSEVDAGASDSLAITPLKLANWSGKLQRFSTDIGDGSATSYVVSHNFGTRDLQVNVYRNSGAFDEVLVDIEHTSSNSVTIKFSVAPASNAFRVVCLG